MIVRAQEKPGELIAPELLCCESFRSRQEGRELNVFEVDPSTAERRMTVCESCGAKMELTAMEITRVVRCPSFKHGGLIRDFGSSPGTARAILVDFYDLDEGPAA